MNDNSYVVVEYEDEDGRFHASGRMLTTEEVEAFVRDAEDHGAVITAVVPYAERGADETEEWK
jgi:hypothetical protein